MLARFSDLNAIDSGKPLSIHNLSDAIVPFHSSQEPLTGLRVAFFHRCPTPAPDQNLKIYLYGLNPNSGQFWDGQFLTWFLQPGSRPMQSKHCAFIARTLDLGFSFAFSIGFKGTMPLALFSALLALALCSPWTVFIMNPRYIGPSFWDCCFSSHSRTAARL